MEDNSEIENDNDQEIDNIEKQKQENSDAIDEILKGINGVTPVTEETTAKEEVVIKEELSKKTKFVKDFYEWVESGIFAVVFVVLLFTFGARTSIVSGVSMDSTLASGEMLLISRLGYSAQQGDIVVATKPYKEDSEPLIKRIIATEGQEVDIDFEKGVVYVNGNALEEPYTNTLTNLYEGMDFPVTVPEGNLFLMGDNRNMSHDSRSLDIGFVDERYILGKAYIRLFPFNRMGSVYD